MSETLFPLTDKRTMPHCAKHGLYHGDDRPCDYCIIQAFEERHEQAA